MVLGIVVERRDLDHRWSKESWRPVAVVPGAAPVHEWKTLGSGDGWEHYLIGSLPLEIHRKETEAYRTNLAGTPRVFVGLRFATPEENALGPIVPFLVTASPYEAQDYLDAGEDVIEGIAMPDGLIAWVQTFIDEHHVDEPFKKRRRGAAPADPFRYGQAPVGRRRRRTPS